MRVSQNTKNKNDFYVIRGRRKERNPNTLILLHLFISRYCIPFSKTVSLHTSSLGKVVTLLYFLISFFFSSYLCSTVRWWRLPLFPCLCGSIKVSLDSGNTHPWGKRTHIGSPTLVESLRVHKSHRSIGCTVLSLSRCGTRDPDRL